MKPKRPRRQGGPGRPFAYTGGRRTQPVAAGLRRTEYGELGRLIEALSPPGSGRTRMPGAGRPPGRTVESTAAGVLTSHLTTVRRVAGEASLTGGIRKMIQAYREAAWLFDTPEWTARIAPREEGARRPRAKPVPGDPVVIQSFSLDAEDIALVRSLGNGSLSAGLRELIVRFLTLPCSRQEQSPPA